MDVDDEEGIAVDEEVVGSCEGAEGPAEIEHSGDFSVSCFWRTEVQAMDESAEEAEEDEAEIEFSFFLSFSSSCFWRAETQAMDELGEEAEIEFSFGVAVLSSFEVALW